MSYRHVEDTAAAPPTYFKNGYGVSIPAEHVRHSVWRCEHCKALAVGPFGRPPPTKCGKCKR